MRLATIFTDHMVFQKGMPIRIFGEGRGTVRVSFLEEEKELAVQEDSWCVELAAGEYGGPYEMQVVLDEEEIILRDLYVGEVWLAAGQSNMEMPLMRSEYGFEEASHCANDKIRFFMVPRRVQKDSPIRGWHFAKSEGRDTPWQLCCEESALPFSAIGYYAAKELQAKLGCAVGVISCNWGGRVIETYIGKEWIAKEPCLQEYYQSQKALTEGWSEADYEAHRLAVEESLQKRYEMVDFDELQAWREKGLRATTGFPGGAFPVIPEGPYHPNAMGCLYDSMYARILPYGIKGIMWYQGESNAAALYKEKYLLYMRCMKESFRNPELVFYAVELAGHNAQWSPDGHYLSGRFAEAGNWAFKREQQQLATQAAPDNYLITSMEQEDLNDIHPIRKKELGHRMAIKILKHSYGFDICADQPVFRAATFEGNKAILEFDHAEGLYAIGGTGGVFMYIADESQVLKKATIEIQGEKLILTSEEVEHPCLVRYAFDNYYLGRHIYNKGGLPMAPFRTDRAVR